MCLLVNFVKLTFLGEEPHRWISNYLILHAEVGIDASFFVGLYLQLKSIKFCLFGRQPLIN